MRKLYTLLLVAAISFTAINTANARDTQIAYAQLPQTAQDFITAHFNGIDVVYAEKDRDGYELRLGNGTEVEFNRKGDWKKVDTEKSSINVPQSVIDLLPAKALNFINEKHPEGVISEISKGRREISVKVNRMEIEFNYTGDFIRYDD